MKVYRIYLAWLLRKQLLCGKQIIKIACIFHQQNFIRTFKKYFFSFHSKFRTSPGQFQCSLNGKITQLYVPTTQNLINNLYWNFFWCSLRLKEDVYYQDKYPISYSNDENFFEYATLKSHICFYKSFVLLTLQYILTILLMYCCVLVV